MGPIPNDALVGSSELPATARTGLTRWLFALDAQGKAAFQRFLGASELRIPSPAHYEAMRHVLRAARARGQDALPPESRMRMRISR
jgi:ABC-type phosphate/phosphonate transport system substrate-binding protein